MALKGADGEGRLVAFVIGKARARLPSPKRCWCKAARCAGGAPVDSLIGVPAVVGSMVLVPWSSQFISAIESHKRARVRARARA